jgi:hypothetical protein
MGGPADGVGREFCATEGPVGEDEGAGCCWQVAGRGMRTEEKAIEPTMVADREAGDSLLEGYMILQRCWCSTEGVSLATMGDAAVD